jgi:hypothetical protein
MALPAFDSGCRSLNLSFSQPAALARSLGLLFSLALSPLLLLALWSSVAVSRSGSRSLGLTLALALALALAVWLRRASDLAHRLV